MYACGCVHMGVSGCVYVGVRGPCAHVHCSRLLVIEIVYAMESSVGSKDFCKGLHFTTFTFLLR